MQTIDRYNKLILSKLPGEITKELEEIKSSTNNFQDEELMNIFQDNFNDLYEIIEKKHPAAIKPKMKIIVPEKRKIKEPGKIKPIAKGGKINDEKYIVSGLNKKGNKWIYLSKPLTKSEAEETKMDWEKLASELTFETMKYSDFKISKAKKSELEEEINCEDAIKMIREYRKKKAEAAEKRAKTIKKKTRSERIKERIGKVFSSIKKADKENKFSEQIEQLEKFHINTTAHLLRYIRKNDTAGIEKLVKIATEESKI